MDEGTGSAKVHFWVLGLIPVALYVLMSYSTALNFLEKCDDDWGQQGVVFFTHENDTIVLVKFLTSWRKVLWTFAWTVLQ